jgi:desosaminyltransferase auxiliary protein
MTTMERGRLGGRLQMARGWRWAFGVNGDPYAMLLCGHDDDPWRWYDRVREAGPDGFRSRTGTWVITGHAEAAQVLDDPGFSRIDPSAPDWAAPFGNARPSTKTRSPGRDQLVPAYRQVLAELTGPTDLMRDFAREGAVRAAASLLGLSDVDSLRAHLLASRVGLDAQLSPQRLEVTEDAITARAALETLTHDSDLAALIGTGTEMAATAICHAVLAILGTAGLVTALAREPDLAAGIAAETIRFTPPVHLERRTSTEDCELAATRIEAGTEVVVAIAAANRDPKVFRAADVFEPDREDLGATLTTGGHDGMDEFVTTHVEAALHALTPRLSELTVTGPVIYRRRSPVLRGISRCPVQL